jgi:hypothetical protein
MAREYKSPIVDLLTQAAKPMTSGDIAAAFGQTMENMGPRLRDLEANGKVSRVGKATRLRDVRWRLPDPNAPKRVAVAYGAIESIEAMRAAARARLLEGKRADWMQEPGEVAA